jgi:hypothetical protein
LALVKNGFSKTEAEAMDENEANTYFDALMGDNKPKVRKRYVRRKDA